MIPIPAPAKYTPSTVGARDRDPPAAAADVIPAPATKAIAPVRPAIIRKTSSAVKFPVRPEAPMATAVSNKPNLNATLSLKRRPIGAAIQRAHQVASRVGCVHRSRVCETPAEIGSHRWEEQRIGEPREPERNSRAHCQTEHDPQRCQNLFGLGLRGRCQRVVPGSSVGLSKCGSSCAAELSPRDDVN